jgi:predicted glycoside hydrolase/deacetylase ChbG (UPF0249 family)
MKIRVHADDFGASRGVTDGVLRCIDEGPVRGVSLLANGVDFERAVQELRARPHVVVAVHLNLVEGKPLRPRSEVDLLVDAGGELRHSFFSLWKAHAFAGASRRVELERQVREELFAQGCKVRAALGAGFPLRLDSHQHLHHIPFVLEIAADLCRELPAVGLRLAREPSFLRVRAPRRGGAAGYARQTLLNALSARHRPKLDARGIACDDWFVGSELSCRLSPLEVDAYLHRIDELAGKDSRETTVEVAVHPGGAAPGEEGIWADDPSLREFYFSTWRAFEHEQVRSPAMAECLTRWRGINAPAARPSGSTTAS